MTEPIPDPPAPDAASTPPPELRPDWLVGAEEGVSAEFDRKDVVTPTPALKLSRPMVEPEGPRPARPTFDRSSLANPGEESRLDLAADPAQQAAGGALRLPNRGGAPHAPAAPEKKKAWTAAASSVPSLKLVKSASPAPTMPASVRAQKGAEDDEQALEFPEAVPTGTPALTVVPGGAGHAGPTRPAAPRVAPPREAWWVVALDELRANRQVQIIAGGALVLVIAVTVFWPRGEMGTRVSEILSHASQYDGRHVNVNGRVGEVFNVGGGYAFYLHQGNDTLVVFTRSRVPHEREHIAVKGQISTGFLDGLPRQALFETP